VSLKSILFPLSLAISPFPGAIKLNSLEVVTRPSGSPGEVVKMQINLLRTPLGWEYSSPLSWRIGHWVICLFGKVGEVNPNGKGNSKDILSEAGLLFPHSLVRCASPSQRGTSLLCASRLPWGFWPVQVGDQIGRARLCTAAGPPALAPDCAPSPWPGCASSSNQPLPWGYCVGSEEEWATRVPSF
jgi:hypothetical protein